MWTQRGILSIFFMGLLLCHILPGRYSSSTIGSFHRLASSCLLMAAYKSKRAKTSTNRSNQKSTYKKKSCSANWKRCGHRETSLPQSRLFITEKGVVASVIKRLIDKLEQTASETLINILIMLDNKDDEHEKRIDKQDERLDDFEDKLDTFQRSFDGTKAEVDSNVDMKKGITKAVINAIIVGVIAWILSRIGIGG